MYPGIWNLVFSSNSYTRVRGFKEKTKFHVHESEKKIFLCIPQGGGDGPEQKFVWIWTNFFNM